MMFHASPLAGAGIIEMQPLVDERGFFARAFCTQEFAKLGLQSTFAQANNTLTKTKGTVRGFHYQLPPSAEVKVVRCIRGSVYDVIVDIRPHSATYLQSFGAELSQDNRRMMYVPRGFAHGFMSLTDDSELYYMVSTPYDRDRERGLRHDDPALGVTWPLPVTTISAKDSAWPDLDLAFHGLASFSEAGA
jgi:dTDP-4-dehydrorhamnose 3,5-epimerase